MFCVRLIEALRWHCAALLEPSVKLYVPIPQEKQTFIKHYLYNKKKNSVLDEYRRAALCTVSLLTNPISLF